MKLWMIVPFSLMIGGILLWNTINEKIDQDICNASWVEITDTPTDLGLAFEEVQFTTSDGIELEGWFIPGDSDVGIVMASGYTDSMSTVLKYAPFLNQAGYNLLLFHPRGYAKRNCEKPVYAYGAFQAEDIEAGIEFMRQRGSKRIALFGHSNGAVATLFVASRHPNPEVFAVVVDSAFANLKLASESPEFQDPLLDTLFPLFMEVAHWRLGFDMFGRTNVLKNIDQVSHVFFIHGTGDQTIAYYNSELLYAHAQEPKELWLLDGPDHVKSYDANPDLYAQKVLSFLEQHKPE